MYALHAFEGLIYLKMDSNLKTLVMKIFHITKVSELIFVIKWVVKLFVLFTEGSRWIVTSFDTAKQKQLD